MNLLLSLRLPHLLPTVRRLPRPNMPGRPDTFDSFHGQSQALAQLRVSVKAAKKLGRPHSHTLLVGSAGLGKSLLAGHVLANELGVPCVTINCASVERQEDILPTVSTMKAGSILFLDEIHALPRNIQEVFYPVLQESQLSIVLGEDDKKQILNITLPKFCVTAATTREGLLPEPLRDRFRQTIQLEPYSDDELVQVLSWLAANSEAQSITQEAAEILAVPCHGTARKAVSFIESAIETAAAEDAPSLAITAAIADRTLARLRYAPTGLSCQEVKLLEVLARSRGAVGLNTLAGIVDVESASIEDVYEPWLLRQGLMEKTPGGRVITERGRGVLKAST